MLLHHQVFTRSCRFTFLIDLICRYVIVKYIFNSHVCKRDTGIYPELQKNKTYITEVSDTAGQTGQNENPCSTHIKVVQRIIHQLRIVFEKNAVENV